MDGGYQNLVKEAKRKGVYRAADSFVNRDMVIQEDMVQAYINNPDDINELCREEWEGHIRDDIEGYSEEIFNKLGMDIDEYDSEEIEYVLDAALEADRSDIAGAMARNMGPRTLSLASINDEDEREPYSALRANREMLVRMNGSMSLEGYIIVMPMSMD